MVLILLVYSYCIGSPATSWRMFVTYAVMCFAPMILRVAADGSPGSLAMVGLVAGGLLVTLAIGWQYRRVVAELLAMKTGNQRLAEQLRQEKLVAEQARAAAEEADRAKTRFIATASHDLHQPLHALALFADTLRHRARDDDTAALAQRMSEAVSALENLFAELMDLSNLDAGKVEARPRDFALEILYSRLRPHFEPPAFDKGLALRFRGGHRRVHADPVLLERVLRNLVSNAIRFTDDGGVLVGCRQRGGMLQLQVWDSGVGIRPEVVPHIFEEFYQVADARPVNASAQRGRGLGLAIVKRLVEVMGARVHVKSIPQRGSVFTIDLPVGKSSGVSVEASLSPQVTLAGVRVLVVDRDEQQRSQLVAMLQRWSAGVQALGGLNELQGWLTGSAVPRVDLAIVADAPGETDDQWSLALEQLGAATGRDVPTIRISGAAAPQAGAAASGGAVAALTRPVTPIRLRALITHKLGASKAPA